eukprot:COSAG02_NODE_928_length_15853_cov_9.053574_4_plen_304_part_00
MSADGPGGAQTSDTQSTAALGKRGRTGSTALDLERDTRKRRQTPSASRPEAPCVPDPASGWMSASVPTPAQLNSRLWSTMHARVDSGRPRVVGFYHQNKVNGCFSNFAATAFTFELPAGLLPPRSDSTKFPSTVTVECSEKAIMLCKAAAFGDSESYRQIARAASPDSAKQLGRKVSPFDDARWQNLVCYVAREVVYQKFSKVPPLKKHLLGTGSQILAEATRNDRIWGIGLNTNEDISVPAQWRGTNVLGWALMQARDRLRAESVSTATTSTASDKAQEAGRDPALEGGAAGRRENARAQAA